METIEENFCKPTLSREISPVYLSVIPANQLYIRERFVYKEFAVQHRRLSLFNTMSIKIILFFFFFTFRRICICLIINGQKFIRRTWVIFRYFRNYSRMYLRLSYLLLTQLREIMHPRIICLFISFFFSLLMDTGSSELNFHSRSKNNSSSERESRGRFYQMYVLKVSSR